MLNKLQEIISNLLKSMLDTLSYFCNLLSENAIEKQKCNYSVFNQNIKI